MYMSKNDKVINFLLDVARRNNGQQTDEERRRKEAVAFLTGKQTSKPSLRPEVRRLLGKD
jgi:hypothetical protein